MDESKIKRLYTCGCSFMSIDIQAHNHDVSFLDLYAQEKKFNHISLARTGATNYVIRLQIDRAIKDQADYVIVGATSSDRMDVITTDDDFGIPLTLDNISYHKYNCVSENHVDNRRVLSISNTINNLLEREPLSASTKQAIKQYTAELHNYSVQQHKDALIIETGLRALERASIPFIFIPGPLFHMDWSWLGDRLWQGAQPWDMPDGIGQRTLNHNPQSAHDKFFKILLNLTPKWS